MVSATTSCQEGDQNASTEAVATRSHLAFTCGGCQIPQSSSGTSYQFTYVEESECTVSTLQTYYEQSEPYSSHEISDAKWVDCFGDDGLNGCYFILKLKATDSNDTVDSNTTTDEPNNDSSIDTSSIESYLQRIEDNTRDTSSHLVDMAKDLAFIADQDFNENLLYESSEIDANKTRNKAESSFETMLALNGLDFNESNGSMFDTYKSSIQGFHGSVYDDLLDDNSTYSIKTLFGDVVTNIVSLGQSTNPFLFLDSKGSAATFEDIVISYQHPDVTWLAWDVEISSEVLFEGSMITFWFMIKVFLIFFAVLYGFMILIEGL